MSTVSAILREMPVQPVLRRLVVIRNDRQARGRAGFLRRLGELDRLGGRVPAGAGDHRDAAFRVLDRDPDQFLVLVEIDGRRFAGRADYDDAVGAFRNMPIDQLAKARDVESPVLVHRRDDRNQASGNHEPPLTANVKWILVLLLRDCTNSLYQRRFRRSDRALLERQESQVGKGRSNSPGRSRNAG
jgi:hypothetical protein